MPQVTYIEPSGNEQQIDVPVGWSLMQSAMSNGVEGIALAGMNHEYRHLEAIVKNRNGDGGYQLCGWNRLIRRFLPDSLFVPPLPLGASFSLPQGGGQERLTALGAEG